MSYNKAIASRYSVVGLFANARGCDCDFSKNHPWVFRGKMFCEKHAKEYAEQWRAQCMVNRETDPRYQRLIDDR